MTQDVSDEQTEQASGIFGLLAAVSLVAAAIALGVVYGLSRFIPVLAPNVSVQVVSFDVVKYTNSQRAVASAFLQPGSDSVLASGLLLNVPQRTREAIAEVAGEGTLVMLKQAVVQGQTKDITDEVLRKLGMPTEVPTADNTAYNLDMAPTMLLRPAPAAKSAAPVNRDSRVALP